MLRKGSNLDLFLTSNDRAYLRVLLASLDLDCLMGSVKHDMDDSDPFASSEQVLEACRFRFLRYYVTGY